MVSLLVAGIKLWMTPSHPQRIESLSLHFVFLFANERMLVIGKTSSSPHFFSLVSSENEHSDGYRLDISFKLRCKEPAAEW